MWCCFTKLSGAYNKGWRWTYTVVNGYSNKCELWLCFYTCSSAFFLNCETVDSWNQLCKAFQELTLMKSLIKINMFCSFQHHNCILCVLFSLVMENCCLHLMSSDNQKSVPLLVRYYGLQRRLFEENWGPVSLPIRHKHPSLGRTETKVYKFSKMVQNVHQYF